MNVFSRANECMFLSRSCDVACPELVCRSVYYLPGGLGNLLYHVGKSMIVSHYGIRKLRDH